MPSNRRVETLLSELTLEEKLGLLHQYASAVPRLELGAFRTGTEGLHGVSWLGEATVFPQPVGLGATWDEGLLTRVGRVVGTEVRAKHSDDPSVSLNVWAPVVNPLRHPLWGRNEEGLHEDATFSGRLGSALARGLRGEHPDVWLTVPTLKHFLGYSNETQRAATSTQLRPRVLHEEELPAYLAPVYDGTAGAVMLSYNLVNGVPAHVTPLLGARLRTAPGGDDLFVVSDACAPSNLYRAQGYPDDAHAFGAALGAGVDSFTDDGDDPRPTRAAIASALRDGLITGAQIDDAVRRHLLARSRTGEFDPAADPYRGIEARDLCKPEHAELAREAAAKAVVLLANPSGALPLVGERASSVAVIGELGGRVLTDWYSGTPVTTVSLVDGLRTRFDADPDRGLTGVLVESGNDIVRLRLSQPGHDFDGQDFGEFELSDWGEGVITLRSTANGRFLTRGPGGALEPTANRVGGWVVQESFTLVATGEGTTRLHHLGSTRDAQVERVTGRLVLQDGGDPIPATFVLSTTRAGLEHVGVAAAQATSTVVVVGNDPHLNGRETQDRSTLRLPARAVELVRTARAAAGGPVVLVIVSSYPYALGGLADEVDAVVWTSHGGEQLGEAVSAVLLGESEPYGRLPQTWWARDADLVDVLEYDCIAAASTYAYSTATPLYPLGHGLTYTTLEYGEVMVTGSVEADDLALSVTVRNLGGRTADELVQVYVTAPAHPRGFPRRRLAAASRVRVEPGSAAVAHIAVPRRTLSIWDVVRDDWWLAAGRYQLLVGRSAEDVRAECALDVTGEPAALRSLRGDGVAAVSFDAHDGALLVPWRGLQGEAVTGRASSRPFSVDFHDCDLDGVGGLAVELMAPLGVRASVEVLEGSATGVWRSVGTVQVTGTAEPVCVEVGAPSAPTGTDRAPQPLRLRVRVSARVVLRGLAATG